MNIQLYRIKGTEIINGTAFAGCTDITAVNFPDGIKEVWVNAFYGCTGLHSVTLPTGKSVQKSDRENIQIVNLFSWLANY